MSKNVSELLNRATRRARLFAATTIGIALLALVGWLSGARFLAGQWDTYIPMAPSTALAFLFLAGAQFYFARAPAQRASRLLARVAASIVSLLGLLVLTQFFLGIDLGIEQALSRTNEFLGSTPFGRMSPLIAIAFLLESAALVLLTVPRWRNALTAAALLAASAIVINAVVLIGYAYGAPLLYGGPIVPTAWTTAIAFVLVGVGLFYLAVPGVPALRGWSRTSMRGILLRAFLPLILIVLLLEGWLDVTIQPRLSLNPALWQSLMALAAGGLIVLITGWIARRTGSEIERAQAEIRSLARFPDENPNPVLRFARDGRLLYANLSSQRLLEFWQCEKPGKSLPEAERQLIAQTLERGVSQHEEVSCGEITYWLVLTPILEMDYVNVYGRDITERKRAEGALRESEERFRQVWEATSDAMALSDAEGIVLTANPAYFNLYGYTPEQVIGKSFAIIFPEENRGWAVEQYKIVFASKSIPSSFEAVIRRSDGMERVVESRATFLTVAGRRTAMLSTIRDITERKRAEEALRKSEALLHTVLSNAPITIFATDANGIFTMSDGKGLERVGLKPGENVGVSALALYESLPFVENTGQVTTGGEVFRRVLAGETVTAISQLGEVVFENHIGPIRDQGGMVVGLVGVATDITERKRAEEKLRISEQRFSEIFRANPAPIGIGEIHSGHLVDINESYANFFGYTREELIGKSAVSLWADPTKRDLVVAKLVESGSVHNFEVEFRRKTGEIRDGLLSMEVVPINEIPTLIAMIVDITERKRAEEEVRQSREQLRALAGYLQTAREDERTRVAREIHDDFGQALTAMKIDLAWITKQLPKNKRILRQRANRTLKLIDASIQTVRRIATQLRPGLLDDLGLSAAIEWQVREFSKRTGIQCDLNLGAEDIVLERETATAVFRTLQETLTNVARHAHATRVRVELNNQPDELALVVSNNGKAITEREASDPKSLGLIGMRERARALGGELSVRGVKGQGTTVTLRVPRHVPT